MSSVSATDSGASNVVQTLLNAVPGLSSTLSSSAQTALENAPVADVVQFSQAALQFQEADGLFGASSSSDSTSSTDLTNLLQSLAPAAGSSASPSQLAAYQSAVQLQQYQGLFGTGISPAINLLG